MTTFYRTRAFRPVAAATSAAALLFALLFASKAFAQLTAPNPKEEPPVAYPTEGDGRAVVVVLELVIDAEGKVEKATETSRAPADAPQLFVDRAIEAASKLAFEPARKDGTAIKSKIPYTIRFVPPASPAPSTSASTSTSTGPKVAPSSSPSSSVAVPAAAVASAEPKAEEPVDIHVAGAKIPPPRAPSDITVDSDILEASPHAKGGDLLATVPGVYVGHVEGDAVANNVFLRGFNAEHGQDIEFKVGGIPVNVPSHIHGQGYADLNFVIPEVVRHLRVVEGVYDPRQGDFSVAGSAYYELGVLPRGYRVKGTVGSFGTRRIVGIWAPREESEETFGAVAIRESNGFGPNNRGGTSASGMVQYAFELPANYRLLVFASAYGARAALPGVVRRDDYDAGRLGYYDTYSFPTATAQSAFSTRTSVGFEIDRIAETGAHVEIVTYATLTTFRIRQNFTGFTMRGTQDPTKVGLGDLIEQSNQDTAIGTTARYRSRRYALSSWLSLFVEPGLSFRTHSSDQTQNLLQPPDNQTWDRRVDATIRGTDLGSYLDLDFRIAKRARLSGGVRADALYYDIDDRLGNFTPTFQQSRHEPGFRRTALGIAWGPRGSLVIDVTPWFSPMIAYGEGYRSPQARQLAEGESAPYTKVRSLEAGARVKLKDDRYLFTLAGYQTTLSDDLVFDPAEATLNKVGPTRRRGFVAYAVVRPWDWFLAAASVTYVHATLQAPPSSSVGDPSPAFKEGQLLPYVPPWVFRLDTALKRPLTKIGTSTLDGRIGGGITAISSRPLPYGQRAKPFSVIDMSAGIRYREVELSLDVYNLLDLRWADTELAFTSNWPTRPTPSAIPARHFVAGNPRTLLASITVTL